MTRPLVTISAVFCLLGWLAMACQAPSPIPTGVPLPTTIPTPAPTRAPTPGPGPLTDAEAIALITEEATARGVTPDTLRITIRREPRSASIRYSSPYDVDSSIFQAQMMFIALTSAQAVARVQPPIVGGMHLAVIPGGESEIGLKVTIIDWASLEAWANGSISDQEFMSQWTEGAITRE